MVHRGTAGRGRWIDLRRMEVGRSGVEETEPKPEKKARRRPVARTAKAPRRAPAPPAQAKAAKPEEEAPKKRAPRRKKAEVEAEAKGGE